MRIAAIARLAALASLTMLASGGAHAVYRCGNVYQDTPCDGGGPQPHLTPGKGATPATPSASPTVPTPGATVPGQSPFAAACSRIGQAAQQMVWRREGGATQEAQLSQLPSAGSRDEMIKTLDSVYRKRGSAPEIRAAIEAECLAEKQQAADIAAAIQALQRQQSGANSPPAAPAKATDTELTSGKKSASETGPGTSCASWRSELNSINDAFRQGGNAATMEKLQGRRRGLEKLMVEGRC